MATTQISITVDYGPLVGAILSHCEHLHTVGRSDDADRLVEWIRAEPERYCEMQIEPKGRAVMEPSAELLDMMRDQR